MIKIIKNNSNLFKCHSFMHLYFHHHHLFQEAHIHRQSHNTNFRFLFFLIQIHYGLSKRFFSFIYRIFFALIEFWFTLNVLSIQNIFSVSMSVPMFIFDFRVYFFVYYIKNAQPTHQNTKIPQFKLYLSFIDNFFLCLLWLCLLLCPFSIFECIFSFIIAKTHKQRTRTRKYLSLHFIYP